ncbi:hypothetical protein NC653_012275 [Populus alba x Populus x berolinensis]|uniref:Uncharacterized protein n=1 Tax=Populus alba x Populus x berolinensis TaxID=444605 RepID=A0AAD6R4D0_9ROSI|nr:hypothetical protein NC653_012275 [Populus alba x Populus x berolinensis]
MLGMLKIRSSYGVFMLAYDLLRRKQHPCSFVKAIQQILHQPPVMFIARQIDVNIGLRAMLSPQNWKFAVSVPFCFSVVVEDTHMGLATLVTVD